VRLVRSCVVVCVVAVAVMAAPPVHATYLGDNGKISFDVYTGPGPGYAIWTMNPNGTDPELLIDSGASSAWSPDGSRLAYSCNASENTCTAAADGTDIDVLPNLGLTPQQRPFWSPDSRRLIIDNVVGETHAGTSGSLWRIDVADGGDHIHMAYNAQSGSWSPNGRIAYTNFSTNPFDGWNRIATILATVPNSPTILTDTDLDSAPDWSPDGTKIVFDSFRDGNYEIYVMDSDGSNETRITTTAEQETSPVWSPDGKKIAFRGDDDIWVMNADGTGATNLTNTPGVPEYSPAWQPVAPRGYPRPKSAPIIRVPLVPAFFPCQAPTHIHGPPLEHPSCAPPLTHPAASMTFGAAAPGSSPQATGGVRFAAIPGAPGEPNDADVRISVNLTDVRRASDLSDGTGGLELQVPVRLTEGESGWFNMERTTMQDYTLKLVVPCVETADAAVGSTCSATTTANALVPVPATSRAFVGEGRRAVWELGQVKVWDGGFDGAIETPSDNTALAVQGIFVP
jgi:hypothetical protein